MALVHAEGAEVWEMTSGAATMLGPDAVVIALAPEGPARAGGRRPAGATPRTGARRTIEVGPAPLVAAPTLLPLPADAAEDHAPLSRRAAGRAPRLRPRPAAGRQPDRPDWIERYHSQGLRHILGAGEEAVS